MERLNQHVGEGYKPRIGQKQHLKTIAQAAFKHIPNAQSLIEKHFGTQFHPRGLTQDPPKNQVMHHGFDHSTR
jgi:hypothetical protein